MCKTATILTTVVVCCLLAAEQSMAYTLTVNSGSGDGSYSASQVVDITADTAASGKLFDAWTGDTSNIADVNDPSTTITMPPSNAEITATYTWVVSGLVSRFTFDIDARDTYGANDGTLTDGASVTTDGTRGEVLSLDGTNDYVDLPTDGLTGGRSELTLSMWIKPDETTAGNTIWDEHNNWYWQFSILQGTWYTRDSSTGTTGSRNNDLSMPGLSSGTWQHLAFVYSASGDEKAIYLDGEEDTSSSTSIDVLTSNRSGAYIGRPSDIEYYDGLIDDVRLYSRALSSSEIELLAEMAAEYTLTVNSGTGDGDYAEDAVADIDADAAPSGQEFDEWVGDTEGIASITSASTTLTMPNEDAEITATYTDKTWALTVNSGTGDGSYVVAAVADIDADTAPSGQDFDQWVGDTNGIASLTSASTTLTMPYANAEVTATYTDKTWTLTVNSGTGDGSYVVGSVADIDADAPASGKQFDEWTGDVSGVANVNNASTTLTMPYSDAEITATYEDVTTYALTVNNGSGDGNYVESAVVDITADSAPSGQEFDEWTGNTSGIADASDPTTTLTMPAANQEVTATYIDKTWTLTVNNGTGDGSYVVGTVQDITADSAPSGQDFDQWIGDTAGIASVTTADTTLTMPYADAEITATYADKTWTLTVNSGTGDGSYVVGAVADIDADAPASGKQFDEWVGDTSGIASVTASDTTLTMPYADAEITATYADTAAVVYNIDFSDLDGDPSPGSSWYTKADDSTTTVTLTDSTGSTNGGTGGNGVTLALGSNWGDGTYSNQNGAFDGGDFAAAGEDYLYVDNTTATATFTFYGTSAESDWKVEIVSSRGSSGSTRTGDYTVESSFSDDSNSDNFNAYDDGYVAGDVMEWADVTPDGSDQITVSVTASTSGYGYINAIRLTGEAGSATTYTLTVNSGTGDGNYAESAVVDIDADSAPSGYAFDEWTGDTAGIASLTSASTTITMQAANAEITATYDAVTLYTLTVNSGTGDGSYQEDWVVDIDADSAPSGYAFDEWTGETAGIASVTSASTTITMPPANAEITATYEATTLYALTVNSGSGDGNYAESAVVDITADSAPSGYVFDDWVGNTAGVASVTSASTTITMQAANAEITATYDAVTLYTLTVNSGTGDGSYQEDWVVDIDADSPASGKQFDEWVGDTVGIASVVSSSTTMTMPASNAAITATYEDVGTEAMTCKVDFGDANVPQPDSSWYTKADVSTTTVTLTDVNGSTNGGTGGNGVTLTMSGGWQDSSQKHQSGEFNDTVLSLAEGAEDYHFVTGGTVTATLNFYGTSASKDWKFEVVSSRLSAGSTREADFEINDASADTNNSVDFNAYADGAVNGDLMVWDQVSPDGSDEIVVELYAASGMYGYLNAVRLTEVIQHYTLTVNSGTGDGNHNANTVVDILADTAPSGQEFDEWVGDTDGIASLTSSPTTLTMSTSNAEVTATYENAIVPSVSGVSGTISHGESITISGSGFGTKSYGSAPQKYEDFEDGTHGNLLNTTGYWHLNSNNPTEDKPQFSNAETRHTHSGLSGKFIEYGLQDITYTPDLNFSGRKIYMDLWLRFKWASLTETHQNKLFKFQSAVNDNSVGASPRMNFYAWRYGPGHTGCYIPLSNCAQVYTSCPGDAPAWYHWQMELLNNQIGSANGEYRVWRNGTLIAQSYDLEPRETGDNHFNCFWLGRYLGNDDPPLSNTLYYDEVYLDDSWARVEIGNASTWTNCTHRETQIPSSWSSSSVTVAVNQGTFADSAGAYLYVTDDDGNVNYNGYSITFAD